MPFLNRIGGTERDGTSAFLVQRDLERGEGAGYKKRGR